VDSARHKHGCFPPFTYDPEPFVISVTLADVWETGNKIIAGVNGARGAEDRRP
jgi:hypothetical protein